MEQTKIMIPTICSYLSVCFHKGNFWSEVGTKMPVKRREVDIFLLGLYQNAAGMLPNKLLDFCLYWFLVGKYFIQDSRHLMRTPKNMRFKRCGRAREHTEKLVAKLGVRGWQRVDGFGRNELRQILEHANIMKNPSWPSFGGKDVVRLDETDDEADDSIHVGPERLEEDEELRLHILGVKSFFTKLRP